MSRFILVLLLTLPIISSWPANSSLLLKNGEIIFEDDKSIFNRSMPTEKFSSLEEASDRELNVFQPQRFLNKIRVVGTKNNAVEDYQHEWINLDVVVSHLTRSGKTQSLLQLIHNNPFGDPRFENLIFQEKAPAFQSKKYDECVYTFTEMDAETLWHIHSKGASNFKYMINGKNFVPNNGDEIDGLKISVFRHFSPKQYDLSVTFECASGSGRFFSISENKNYFGVFQETSQNWKRVVGLPLETIHKHRLTLPSIKSLKLHNAEIDAHVYLYYAQQKFVSQRLREDLLFFEKLAKYGDENRLNLRRTLLFSENVSPIGSTPVLIGPSPRRFTIYSSEPKLVAKVCKVEQAKASLSAGSSTCKNVTILAGALYDPYWLIGDPHAEVSILSSFTDEPYIQVFKPKIDLGSRLTGNIAYDSIEYYFVSPASFLFTFPEMGQANITALCEGLQTSLLFGQQAVARKNLNSLGLQDDTVCNIRAALPTNYLIDHGFRDGLDLGKDVSFDFRSPSSFFHSVFDYFSSNLLLIFGTSITLLSIAFWYGLKLENRYGRISLITLLLLLASIASEQPFLPIFMSKEAFLFLSMFGPALVYLSRTNNFAINLLACAASVFFAGLLGYDFLAAWAEVFFPLALIYLLKQATLRTSFKASYLNR